MKIVLKHSFQTIFSTYVKLKKNIFHRLFWSETSLKADKLILVPIKNQMFLLSTFLFKKKKVFLFFLNITSNLSCLIKNKVLRSFVQWMIIHHQAAQLLNKFVPVTFIELKELWQVCVWGTFSQGCD